jgi:hypothetical protein
MPMIDVYAAAGTFGDPHALAQKLASELMAIEQVPDIPLYGRTPRPSSTSCRRQGFPTSTATAPTSGSRC